MAKSRKLAGRLSRESTYISDCHEVNCLEVVAATMCRCATIGVSRGRIAAFIAHGLAAK